MLIQNNIIVYTGVSLDPDFYTSSYGLGNVCNLNANELSKFPFSQIKIGCNVIKFKNCVAPRSLS